MLPVIVCIRRSWPINETLVVEPVGPSDVRKGDIVLYRSNGSLIAHRIMGIVRDDKADEYSSLLQVFCPEETRNAPEAVYRFSFLATP